MKTTAPRYGPALVAFSAAPHANLGHLSADTSATVP